MGTIMDKYTVTDMTQSWTRTCLVHCHEHLHGHDTVTDAFTDTDTVTDMDSVTDTVTVMDRHGYCSGVEMDDSA